MIPSVEETNTLLLLFPSVQLEVLQDLVPLVHQGQVLAVTTHLLAVLVLLVLARLHLALVFSAHRNLLVNHEKLPLQVVLEELQFSRAQERVCPLDPLQNLHLHHHHHPHQKVLFLI